MGYIKQVIYNCKRATSLIEKKQTRQLNLRERLELRVHLYRCPFCRLYQKQNRVIDDGVQALFKSSLQPGAKLDANLKKLVRERIEEEANKN